jgi:NitT/TauT family transport system substrate-binding protein
MPRTTGTLVSTAIAALALATVAACGSGSASSDNQAGGASSSSEAAGGADLTTVKVGVIPIVDTAPLWLGKEKGFFKDEGINLEITTTTGGAAAVPGVVSGDFDIAFGNSVSVMVAADKGLPLKFISNGVTTTGKKPDFGGVVVPADSPVKDAGDLAGKTVSVNNLNNIGDTTIRKLVENAGGDPNSIKFVEVAFPDAPAAVERKQVDAAWILEPFLSAAVGNGARVVSYNYTEFDPNLDIAGYFTKTQTVEGKKEMVEGFQRAMKKSLEYAQGNPQEVRDIVGTYTKIDAAGREKMTLPRFVPEFNRDAFAKLGEAAVSYGTLKKAPNLDALLPSS